MAEDKASNVVDMLEFLRAKRAFQERERDSADELDEARAQQGIIAVSRLRRKVGH